VRLLSALLLTLCFTSAQALADSKTAKAPPQLTIPETKPVAESLVPQQPDPATAISHALDDEWAEIFYRLPPHAQVDKFKDLMKRIREFKTQYPQRAEPLILEAVTLCTLAAADWGLDSLSRINEARGLLEKSIALDLKAMDGTALITLGNLYFRLPGWPISFGDDEQGLQYLEMALQLFPDGLDSNFFLGDYWLGEEEYDKAIPYLEKAEKAPIRPHHRLSDVQIKGEAQKDLKAARNRDNGDGDFFSKITPDFGD